jgi:hypothetical protein
MEADAKRLVDRKKKLGWRKMWKPERVPAGEWMPGGRSVMMAANQISWRVESLQRRTRAVKSTVVANCLQGK